MGNNESLWPDDMQLLEELAPVTILRLQASLLGNKTKNLVEAEVNTQVTDDYGNGQGNDNTDTIKHVMSLVAPALDFYRHNILSVTHKVTKFYPLTVTFTANETDNNVTKMQANNEEEFQAALATALQSPYTKEVISVMLSQSIKTS